MTAAAVVALVGVGALYGSGAVGLAGLGFALLVGFPVYLLFAASALSVWLGFTKDATDLRRVYVERERARQ